MRDLSYISNREDVTEVPMRVTGECSGNALLAQKAITMMLTDPEGYMRGGEGGGLGKVVGGANIPAGREDLMNLAAIAASEVSGDLALSQSGSPDTERLARLSVTNANSEGDAVNMSFDVEPVEGSDITVTITPTRG